MRLDDWQLRFSAFAKDRASMPFAWGSNDCCLFAADAVLEMTGTDPAADLRGTYTDAREALRTTDAHGGLRAIATARLGDPLPPLMAMVGDVVLVMNQGRELLAICNGTSVLAPGPEGMAVLSMDDAMAVWRI